MSAERFDARMNLLRRLGYAVLPLGEAIDRWEAGALPKRSVVITIDDGWYGTFRHMLPILKRHGFPATVYVTTYFVRNRYPVLSVLLGYIVAHAKDVQAAARAAAETFEVADVASIRTADQLTERLSDHLDSQPGLEKRWHEVSRLAAALEFDMTALLADRRFHLMGPEELKAAHEQGFDLQLHTHRHRMYGFDGPQLEADLMQNRNAIAEMSGGEPGAARHFCYPSGVHDSKIYPILEKLGVVSATTTAFGLNAPKSDRYRLSRILDCESLSDLELEARLCGFWSVLQALRLST